MLIIRKAIRTHSDEILITQVSFCKFVSTKLAMSCGAGETPSQWIHLCINWLCSCVLLPAEPTDKFRLEMSCKRKVGDGMTHFYSAQNNLFLDQSLELKYQ